MPANTKGSIHTLYQIAYNHGHETGAITYGVHHGATKAEPSRGAKSARYKQWMEGANKRREEWHRELELYVLERIKAIHDVNGRKE